MSLEDNKQIVRRFIEEAINKGNVDASGDYIAEDVIELVPFPGQGPGLSGLKDVLKGLRLAFPDMHWTIEEQIAEADKVLTRFVWTEPTTLYFFWRSCHGDARNGLGDGDRPH
jgi:predicted ester cyclase